MNDDLMMKANQGPTVDPMKYPAYKCDKCGGIIFEQAVTFRTIPGLVVGAGGEDINYPIPVYICKNCGVMMKEVREEFEKADEKLKNTEQIKLNSGGLII